MLILVALCAAIISVILTILILKAKYEKRLSNFQDSVLKKQRDEVQNIYQTMRAWRHDYHNHIQSIKAMIAMDKKEELSDYLDNLEKDLDSIDIAIRTGNVGLDAILSSKVSIARKNNIDVNCTAKVPSNLTITDVHLCAIVGNLMDNAIEACRKVEADRRVITVNSKIVGDTVFVSIKNPISGDLTVKNGEVFVYAPIGAPKARLTCATRTTPSPTRSRTFAETSTRSSSRTSISSSPRAAPAATPDAPSSSTASTPTSTCPSRSPSRATTRPARSQSSTPSPRASRSSSTGPRQSTWTAMSPPRRCASGNRERLPMR